MSDIQNGHLVGWLVSYSLNPKGLVHEIRTGRTLITSLPTSNEKDLIIGDKKVSAPHIAIKATPDHSVEIQDVFSEAGSSISKGESGETFPISGPTKLEHGDWIKIGQSAKFQLCLIDDPSS